MKLSQKIEQLERLVGQIESDHVDLEQAAKLYAKTVQLSQQIAQDFATVQTEVSKLSDSGKMVVETLQMGLDEQ